MEQQKAARAEAEAVRQGENLTRLARDVALDTVCTPTTIVGFFIMCYVAPMNAVGQKIEAPRDEINMDLDVTEADPEEKAVFERFMRMMKEKE